MESVRGGVHGVAPGFNARGAAPKLTEADSWRVLANITDEAEFSAAWLALQCSRLPNAVAGLLRLQQHGDDTRSITATWPESNLDPGHLAPLADRALAERRTVVAFDTSAASTNNVRSVGLLIAVPLGTSGEPIAVAAVALAASRDASSVPPESIAEQLRWGSGWLETISWARRARQDSVSVARAASLLDVLAVVGEHARLKTTLIALSNDLAVRLHCDRVSIGLLRKGAIRLRALSHSVSFRKQSRLVETIENAMEEASDQRTTIAHPALPTRERCATLLHRNLIKTVGVPGACVASVVLTDRPGKPIGVITLERHRDEPFNADTLQIAEMIAGLLGPTISLQLRAERMIAGRIADGTAYGLKTLLGPRRLAPKLAAIGVAGIVAFMALAEGEHRLTARSVIEAEVQRAAVAPFDGFIRSAPLRAGDTVRKNDLLAALEDRDLMLDRLKWRAERDKLLQRYREALAKHDRTNVTVFATQIRQAEAQLALAEEKLARARIEAPFDGIVVSGDLSQMLGSPVERGKVLFEVAPLDRYRLIVHLDERDVRYAVVGQQGTVALAGMPADPVPLTLTKITPVMVADEGRNTYRIEARLGTTGMPVRPGMEGVARIEVGQRSLFWIWTHAIVEWLHLSLWRYLP